jgi:hypothetical protein
MVFPAFVLIDPWLSILARGMSRIDAQARPRLGKISDTGRCQVQDCRQSLFP